MIFFTRFIVTLEFLTLYRVRTIETVLGLELRDAFPSKQGSSGGFHDDEGSICT